MSNVKCQKTFFLHIMHRPTDSWTTKSFVFSFWGMSKDECFFPRWRSFSGKNGNFVDFWKMENHAPIPLSTVKKSSFEGEKCVKGAKSLWKSSILTFLIFLIRSIFFYFFCASLKNYSYLCTPKNNYDEKKHHFSFLWLLRGESNSPLDTRPVGISLHKSFPLLILFLSPHCGQPQTKCDNNMRPSASASPQPSVWSYLWMAQSSHQCAKTVRILCEMLAYVTKKD